MKRIFLLIFAITSITTFAKENTPKIFSLEEVLNSINVDGTFGNAYLVDRMSLLGLDSSLTKTFIDLDLKFNTKADIYTKQIKCYNLKITQKIASYYHCDYAAEKLFEYYKSVPKFIKSDTIYHMYNDLSNLLPILIYYKPNGLKERLKDDYYAWQKISKDALQRKYLDIKEKKWQTICSEYEAFIPDYHLIALNLATALKLLNEPGFDDNLLIKLKNKLSNSNSNSVAFNAELFSTPEQFIRNHPDFIMIHPGRNISNDSNSIFKKTIVNANKNYHDMLALIKDTNGLNIIFNSIDICCYAKIESIIYKDNKALFTIRRDNGSDTYLVTIKDKSLIINLSSREQYRG